MDSQLGKLKLNIGSLAKLVESKVTREGWNAYLMTFMFHPIPGGRQAKLQTMSDAVYRFYATFLTRVVRKPNSPFHSGERPLLFAAPDYPVQKRKKQSPSDFALNDGLHFHGILAVPLKSRLKEDVISHIQSRFATYVKNPLKRIDAVLIENQSGFVTDYALKSLKRSRFNWDDVMILPKSRAEIGATSELQNEMARWVELGLFPSILPKSKPVSRPTETDAKSLLELARSFRLQVTQHS